MQRLKNAQRERSPYLGLQKPNTDKAQGVVTGQNRGATEKATE